MFKQMIVAAPLVAGVSHAQTVRFVASTMEPVDGEVVRIDVVLDATSYSDPFAAWQQIEFKIPITASGLAVDASQISNIGESLLETAGSDTDGDGVIDLEAAGEPWVGGRRPGAFPFNGARAGGIRLFGDLYEADVIEPIAGGVTIGSDATGGRIGGFQDPPGSPTFNELLHRGRVFEVFRFSFTYFEANGTVTFDTTDLIATVYERFEPSAQSVFIQDQTQQLAMVIPATPATLALAGGALFGACRRRS